MLQRRTEATLIRTAGFRATASFQSNRVVNDEDTGVIELSGPFFTFKGRKYVRRCRFVNLQQTLDGSTVLSLWPDKEMSQINPKTDTEYYIRAAKK